MTTTSRQRIQARKTSTETPERSDARAGRPQEREDASAPEPEALQLQRTAGNRFVQRQASEQEQANQASQEDDRPRNGGTASETSAPVSDSLRSSMGQALGIDIAATEPPGVNGAQVSEIGGTESVEQPASNPPAQEQANRVAAENTRQSVASDEPEFAESVETAPPQGAQLEGEAFRSDAESDTGAAEQTSDLDAAQATEQQSGEATSDEAEEEMDEAAKEVTQEGPVEGEGGVEEGGEGGAGGAEEGGESTSAAETASQAMGMLAAPMSEAATLSSNGVVFAPRPEERSGNAINVIEGVQKRAATEALASQFMARNTHHVQSFLALGMTAPPRILTAAETAKAAIDEAVAENVATVQAHLSDVRSQTEAEAQTTIEAITAQHDVTLASVQGAALVAQTLVAVSYMNVSATLDNLETTQVGKIDGLYATWAPRLRKVGTDVGNEAVAQGSARASTWLGQRNGESTLLDGPVHDNKMEARADAANNVAAQYKESLEQEAGKQVTQMLKSKPAVLDTVKNASTQAHESLDKHYQSVMDSLTAGAESVTAQVEDTTSSLVESVNSSLATTITSLDEQEVAQTDRLTQYGEEQKQAIDEDAGLAIESLVTGINDGVTTFNAALRDFAAAALGTQAPDQAVIQPVLAEVQGQIDAMAATMLQQLEASIESAEQGITTGGETAVTALNELGQSAIEQATSTEQGYSEGLTTLLQQGTDGLLRLQEGHADTSLKTANNAQQTFQQAAQNLQTTFTALSEKARTKFEQSEGEMRTGLRAELKDLDSKITEYADEAAKQVQPRWKSALKVLLVVLVVIVVAAITIVSAGSLGPLGVVLLGAALGGLAGGAIQVGNNLIDGKKWSDGVGKAVIIGAIGGAFGGLGGVLAKGVASVGLQLAIEVGLDVVGGIVGSLLVGDPVTLQSIVVGAAIGLGIGGGLAGLSALKGKIKFKPDIDAPAPRVRTDVDAPTPTPRAGGPEVDVPAPTPRTGGPDVDAPAPGRPRTEPPDVDAPQATKPRPETPDEGGRRAAKEATDDAADDATRAGQRSNKPDADPDAPRKSSDADDGGGKRTGKDAAEDAAEKTAELPTALAAARTIAEANDAVNAPVPVVLALLAALKRRFKWIRSFRAQAKAAFGHFKIKLIASEYDVDTDYTADLGDELPEGEISARNASVEGAHDVGVSHGQAAASRRGLTEASWVNPFEFRGKYGQGFDDVLQDNSGNLWIVEYKGGSAGLSEGQMGRGWVVSRIAKYRAQGGELGRFWGDRLQAALDAGKLKGIAFGTPISGTTPGATKMIGTWSY